ncbi:MAG: endonuclease/exonuclease/phosphatase family protein [Kiritimatiellae bacterium]|nr:endonuclease/exonuclease/phosphatase family protein [Kiritimatiellia bacterium]
MNKTLNKNIHSTTVSVWRFAAGCIDAAATLGVFFTFAALLGRLHWTLDILSQGKQALAFCFLGFVIYKLICKSYQTAALALIPLILNAVPPLLLFLPQQQQIAAEAPVRIRILQANVLSSNRNFALLRELIRQSDPDVIVLQETTQQWLKELAHLDAEYPVSAAFPREDNFGVATFCRHTNATAQILFLDDPSMLPISRVELTLNNKTLTITGVHLLPPLGKAYWSERNWYAEKLAAELAKIESAQIVTGDMNNAPWAARFDDFTKTSGLLDCAGGRGALATWPTFLPPILRLPLDHCFHSKEVIITVRRRAAKIGSDHFPMVIEAEF